MKLTSESKLFAGIIGITLVIIVIAVVALSQPAKPIAKNELILSTTHTRGNINAKTWLVEFSDFQCPACKTFETAVETLSKKYPDALMLGYRHFPLPQHPLSRDSALVAEAAGVQGKFFEMGSLLFKNQERLSEEVFASAASELKLDMALFTKNRTEASLAALVTADVDYGNQIGINATPTFYLNGLKLEANSPEELTTAIEAAIKAAK
jgi:protein-disulfide isomerase